MKTKDYQGVTELFVPIYKILGKWVKKTFKDNDTPLHEVVSDIEKVCQSRTKKRNKK